MSRTSIEVDEEIRDKLREERTVRTTKDAALATDLLHSR